MKIVRIRPKNLLLKNNNVVHLQRHICIIIDSPPFFDFRLLRFRLGLPIVELGHIRIGQPAAVRESGGVFRQHLSVKKRTDLRYIFYVENSAAINLRLFIRKARASGIQKTVGTHPCTAVGTRIVFEPVRGTGAIERDPLIPLVFSGFDHPVKIPHVSQFKATLPDDVATRSGHAADIAEIIQPQRLELCRAANNCEGHGYTGLCAAQQRD